MILKQIPRSSVPLCAQSSRSAVEGWCSYGNYSDKNDFRSEAGLSTFALERGMKRCVSSRIARQSKPPEV
jgi:hypothetical protein